MNTKLTLIIKKSVIDQAKLYAKNAGRSLSEIVGNYLVTLTQEAATKDLSPKLKQIVGVVNLPESFDEKEELRSVLEKKHLNHL